MKSVTVRGLRNRFLQVRKLVEASFEAVLTESEVPRYRLEVHAQLPVVKLPTMDYWARLCSYQPKALSKTQSAMLHAANRGER